LGLGGGGRGEVGGDVDSWDEWRRESGVCHFSQDRDKDKKEEWRKMVCVQAEWLKEVMLLFGLRI
jgi:hypothetical protein